MRSYDEIVAGVRADYTFSNMSEFEHWAVRWCARCVYEDRCPIVDAAMILGPNMAPFEWVRPEPGAPFDCSAFEPTGER